jgi:hypothetical protein
VVLTIRMINELKRQENYTESPQFSKEVERWGWSGWKLETLMF